MLKIINPRNWGRYFSTGSPTDQNEYVSNVLKERVDAYLQALVLKCSRSDKYQIKSIVGFLNLYGIYSPYLCCGVVD